MKTQLIVQSQHTYQLKPAVKKANAEQTSAPQAPENKSFIRSSEKGIELAKKLQSEFTSTIYDQPSYNNSKAISTYTAINNQERRAEVQSLIGVNVFV
ncbi:hypothetical protein HG263_06495 [Pseudoalteromonas sp. JBTF-M23]|uniref:Uncharacterized protein n=1 Tax=Pseudoalteromonas caenipelagi TaxID=2726988 RepID=A0A849VBN1_9GAMM|nr:hypothetical protein [Pseudoalteromonas caenipelagi]NOU50190.1 hypothetical protein [Pseudoalteromonas caenipelagi]